MLNYQKYQGQNALEQVLLNVPQKRLEFRQQLSTAGKDTKLYLNKLMQEDIVMEGASAGVDEAEEPDEAEDKKTILSQRAHHSTQKAKQVK